MSQDNNLNINQQKQFINKNWATEAYEDFKERITTKFLICNEATDFDQLADQLNMIKGNSTKYQLDMMRLLACVCCPIYCPIYMIKTIIIVENKHFAMVTCEEGDVKTTVLYGPGYHTIGFYNKLQGIYNFEYLSGNSSVITSEVGDLKIAVVDQGTIMHFEFGGQNIILGPGIHLIKEPLDFKKVVSLDTFYIEIGPEKWVTVPDGYDGISINRGSLKILKGGFQHHLTHVSDKFVKMVPKTLLTDRVPTDIQGYIVNKQGEASQYLSTTTSDGSNVTLDAMIFWRIVDTDLAARTAMEILNTDQNLSNNDENQVIKTAQNNISNLRTTVLRIVKHHLTKLVGRCTLSGKLSDDHHENVKQDKPPKMKNQDEFDDYQEDDEAKQLLPQRQQQQKNNEQNSFDILNVLQRYANTLKERINDELNKIGANLENMCIYSVRPTKDIQIELDRQTKARVDGNTAIITVTARQEASQVELKMNTDISLGNAKISADVTIMQANANAESNVIQARGEAEAIMKVADARRDEAEKLQELPFAKELAKLRVAGEVGQKVFNGTSNNYIFGNSPGDIIYTMLQR